MIRMTTCVNYNLNHHHRRKMENVICFHTRDPRAYCKRNKSFIQSVNTNRMQLVLYHHKNFAHEFCLRDSNSQIFTASNLWLY